MRSSIACIAVTALFIGILPSACAQARRERMRDRAAERREAAQPRSSRSLPASVRVERDIAYGPDPAQRLDVYRPDHAANAPVILVVHGGGWTRGDKGARNVVDNKVTHWLPEGYIVVSVNYRLSPQVDPLEEADDVASALAFAQQRAASWGGDPYRFLLMGHSAGGHLVSLLTADPSIATRRGARPWLGNISLDAAGYNVEEIMESPHLRLYDAVFGSDSALWRAASPTLRLASAPVPVLLVCSSRRVDSCPQARGFAARATSLGGRATVLPIALTHEEINAVLGADGSYTDAVDTFMRSVGLP